MEIGNIVEAMSGNMSVKLKRIRLFLNEGRVSVMVGVGSAVMLKKRRMLL